MASSTSFLALCFIVLAFALGLAQGAYWTEPNVSPCSMSNLTCYNLVDGCSGWSFNKQNVPSTIESSFLYVQRLSVPAGHHFLFKGVNMIYTQKLWTAMNWQQLDILNFTITVWNASLDNPDKPNNWTKPIVQWQRIQVSRGPTGTMWNHAFTVFGNFSAQPISLSAGQYMFSVGGFSGANPATYSAALDSFLMWYQTPTMNPEYADDSFLIYVGANMANTYNPLPLRTSNSSTWTTSSPGRLCTWAVGALTNLSSSSVADPILNYTFNYAGYMVRYFFRQDISEFNVSQFIAAMTDNLNVASISPFARVIVYNVQRMYECISVDWYVTTPQGTTAMTVGLSYDMPTVFNITGVVPNNVPGRIYGTFRDS